MGGFTKSRSAKQKDGLESRCRECRHQAHREKNPPAPHALAPLGMKWCNSGRHYQPHSKFAVCNTSRDGLKWYCKDCVNQKNKDKNAARRALLGPVRPWNKAADIMRPCKRCGTQFRIKPCQMGSARFCSLACTKDRLTVQCEGCSRPFDVARFRIKNVKCCSRACTIQWLGRRTYAGKDGFKKCSGCAEIKPHIGFHKASRNLDGLMDRCKTCHKAQLYKRVCRMKAIGGSFTRGQFRAKWEYWGKRCFYCQSEITEDEATIEHRRPISRGGFNWIANIVAACYDCNAEKNKKTEAEYRRWLKAGRPGSKKQKRCHIAA